MQGGPSVEFTRQIFGSGDFLREFSRDGIRREIFEEND